MQREALSGEHPGPAAVATESVRSYAHHNGALRRSRGERKAERDDVRAHPSSARTGDDNSLGVRVEDVDAVEPAGNGARALAADVGTLLDEELLTGVEARPGSRIVVRRKTADHTSQESCSGNR